LKRQEEQQRHACSIEPRRSVRSPPMWSQIQPDTSRLTIPRPSMSESISAPRAAP